MQTELTRMEGLGNSFIILTGPYSNSSKVIASLCTKHWVDGFLVVIPVNDTLVEMKYWNHDGSIAEMCGNGLRCVARFAVDQKLVTAGKFSVRTDAGVLKVLWDGKDPSKIEVQVGKAKINGDREIDNTLFTTVDVGNPHAVTFVNNVDDAPVKTLGPIAETNHNFPNKTNVEFVQVISPTQISVRTWERGVGETKACGTGMVAAAVASASKDLIQYPVEVGVLGGSAKVWVDEYGYSRMLGPAQLMK